MSNAEAIKSYIVSEFLPDVAPHDLDGDYDLLAGGVIDSLALLKVIAWLEKQFQLPVDDIDLSPESFRTVNQIDAFVLANQPRPR